MVVNVVDTGSAFSVTSFNAGGNFANNSTQTVTWNVAGSKSRRPVAMTRRPWAPSRSFSARYGSRTSAIG